MDSIFSNNAFVLILLLLFTTSILGKAVISSGRSSSLQDNPQLENEFPLDGHERSKRYAPSTNMTVKWPNGLVYYQIDDNLESHKDELEQAIAHIENSSCIRFLERTTEENFILIQQVDTRCTAPIGLQGNGQQNINIYIPECGFYAYLLHQLVQSLGFNHEHQRSDRDKYITIHTENVEPDNWRYFAKLDEGTHFLSDVYDFESVMHYGSLRFSSNGLPTMLMANGSRIKELSEKRALSPLDIQGLNYYYECS